MDVWVGCATGEEIFNSNCIDMIYDDHIFASLHPPEKEEEEHTEGGGRREKDGRRYIPSWVSHSNFSDESVNGAMGIT